MTGAALTYARRYALFTLVGIAGEDDLDAPELLAGSQPQPSSEAPKPQSRAKGNLHSLRPAALAEDKSAELRDRLLQELSSYETDDALAVWAYRSLPLKNTLTREDADAIEAAYLAMVGPIDKALSVRPAADLVAQESRHDVAPAANSLDVVAPLAKPVRRRR